MAETRFLIRSVYALLPMSRDIKLVTLALFLWGSGEGLFFYIMPLYMEQLGRHAAGSRVVLAWPAFLTGLFLHPRRPAGRSL